jgi:hypothetical protein
MINLNKAQAISQDGQPRLIQQYKKKIVIIIVLKPDSRIDFG